MATPFAILDLAAQQIESAMELLNNLLTAGALAREERNILDRQLDRLDAIQTEILIIANR